MTKREGKPREINPKPARRRGRAYLEVHPADEGRWWVRMVGAAGRVIHQIMLVPQEAAAISRLMNPTPQPQPGDQGQTRPKPEPSAPRQPTVAPKAPAQAEPPAPPPLPAEQRLPTRARQASPPRRASQPKTGTETDGESV